MIQMKMWLLLRSNFNGKVVKITVESTVNSNNRPYGVENETRQP